MPIPSSPKPVREAQPLISGESNSSAYTSLRNLFLILIPLLLAVQALSLGPWKSRFWGFHLWAQNPWPVAAAAILLWVLAWGVLWRSLPVRDPNVDRVPGGRWSLVLVVSLVTGVVFWFLRTGHTLLGDGYPVSITLPEGGLSPRLPLTKWIQFHWLGWTGPWFSQGGVPTEEVVRRSVALLHVIAGVMFVPVALGLGRVISRAAGSDGKGAGAWLAGAILLTQGFMLFYFGYVEHYSLFSLAVAVYLWTALLYLERRVPLVLPLLTLILAVGLHLTAALLVPSSLILVYVGVRNKKRRMAALRDLGGAVAGVILLDLALGLAYPGYGLKQGFTNLFHTANKDHGGGSGLAYMFSMDHAIDFLNEHFLIGPVAALFLVPLIVFWAIRRGPRTSPILFLVVAAMTALAASWIAAEPTLGYARDWDVFAPMAPVYTAAVIVLILSMVRTPGERGRLLLSALLVSVAHLGCWVLLNHSEPRSLARLGNLTGQKGRNHVTVGNWYLQRNDPAAAETWLRKALIENPGNNDAMNLLGVALAREGKPEEAVESLDHAARLRPDKPEYREDLVRALMETGRYREALPHLEFLREHRSWNPETWIHSAMVLSAAGRNEEAAAVLDQAVNLFEPRLEQLYRRDHDTLVGLGFLFSAAGRRETALDLFARALVLRPDSDVALLQSVSILGEAGRYAEARPLAERFVRRYPEDPESARLVEWMGQLPE